MFARWPSIPHPPRLFINALPSSVIRAVRATVCTLIRSSGFVPLCSYAAPLRSVRHSTHQTPVATLVSLGLTNVCTLLPFRVSEFLLPKVRLPLFFVLASNVGPSSSSSGSFLAVSSSHCLTSVAVSTFTW
ncbi:hypothetical protein R1flu_004677 [Riccia fluitans]|uniref:Uncharacterized protein n=1 Tax=Riccia fluitans TaxID=41844 RepID=A0ABD1YQZ8_9MARC